MKNQIFLALVLLGILFINLATAKKHLKPYCGFKTMDIRTCENDRQCKYDDEYCSRGLCTIAKSLYDKFDCNSEISKEENKDLCAGVACDFGFVCQNGSCISTNNQA